MSAEYFQTGATVHGRDLTPTGSLTRWPITEVFLAGHELGNRGFMGAANAAATAVAHGTTWFVGYDWQDWAKRYWTLHVVPRLVRGL